MVVTNREKWEASLVRNPEIRVLVHTIDRGMVDVTPWVVQAQWGNSLSQGAPPFSITLLEPRFAVRGPRLVDQVEGAEQPALGHWRTAKSLHSMIEVGDWLEVLVKVGESLQPNYLGWVDAVSPSSSVQDDGAYGMTTVISGEAANSVLDMTIVANPFLSALPAYFNWNDPSIQSAFASGSVGGIVTSVMEQVFGLLGESWPEIPPSLISPGSPVTIIGLLDMVTEVAGADEIDGYVQYTGPQMLASFDQMTAREFLAPFIGWPDFTEMYIEARPLRTDPEQWDYRFVFRQHPWDEDPWYDLPVRTVDWSDHNLSKGSGAYFNFFNVIPTLPGQDVRAYFDAGPNSVIPIVDAESIRRFGIHRYQPEFPWGPTPRDTWTKEFHERWNRRLWAWHSLGKHYLQGSMTVRGWRPDVRIGEIVRTTLTDDQIWSFYVEDYSHTVNVDQATGLAVGETQLAVTRGQVGVYADPGDPPVGGVAVA